MGSKGAAEQPEQSEMGPESAEKEEEQEPKEAARDGRTENEAEAEGSDERAEQEDTPRAQSPETPELADTTPDFDIDLDGSVTCLACGTVADLEAGYEERTREFTCPGCGSLGHVELS